MSIKKYSFISIIALALSVSATAQTVFIDDAQIGSDKMADIVITDGQITQIGSDISAPQGARTLPGNNHWVTPGMFASLTGLGLVEIGAEDSTDDRQANDAKTSVSDLAYYGFNSQSPIIDNTRVSGVTHAAIIGNPSHNIFAGTGFTANMSGDLASIENQRAFIYVQLGSRGGKLAGGSRSASMSQLRNALDDAKAYPGRFDGPEDGDALSRRDAKALKQVIAGKTPIIIGANRATDLANIMLLKQDYDLNIIISGAAEGWMVAEELADHDMRVIVDPVANLPQSFDMVGARIDNAKLLADAGVEMALMSFSESTSHNVRVLGQHAGNAVANGLEREVTSVPVMISIDGELQSLQSRQRELRDRYNPTREDTRAHKYRP